MAEIYARHLGPDWAETSDESIWERIHDVPDEELWRARERSREELVSIARRRLRRQLVERGATRTEVEWTDELFDPKVLTVGFARRFAEYKRATLLLSDPGRLHALLTSGVRPMQLVFAGKAHPHDDQGKELIRTIVHFAGESDVRTRVVFLEDYDIALARALYRGVDVWLNNPRRPLEACGTSGMKAALNGALNLSILDGWWAEMFNGENGWAIGKAEEYADKSYQDQVEASALYDLIERRVIPAFYDRREGRVPRSWVTRVKASISSLGPAVRASRMVREYVERLYLPGAERSTRLAADSYKRARRLSEWKGVAASEWSRVEVRRIDSSGLEHGVVGARVPTQVAVSLGALSPSDVAVQLAHGTVDREGELIEPAIETLSYQGADGEDHLFEGSFTCQSAGLYGIAVRVVAAHEDLGHPYETGLVTWA
jgi:starch phosphorylase